MSPLVILCPLRGQIFTLTWTEWCGEEAADIRCLFLALFVIISLSFSYPETHFVSVPVTVCSSPCPAGMRKALQKGRPVCCFDCLPCEEQQINQRWIINASLRAAVESLKNV
uniref:GPCR family 3 nine cysteines domain-containing protein n=1 Tax=Seriola lalandi dorsalis TaxID=1841481 RepID=A0A3B4XV43_SERLL